MSVIEKARNLVDERISDDCRERIQRFLNHPSCDTWDDIHGIAIAPHTTIWQAVRLIDDGVTKRNGQWSAIPLPLTVMRAIREVVK